MRLNLDSSHRLPNAVGYGVGGTLLMGLARRLIGRTTRAGQTESSAML